MYFKESDSHLSELWFLGGWGRKGVAITVCESGFSKEANLSDVKIIVHAY